MSKTTSAELSLINDSEFLEELGQFEAPARRDQGFAALERGLPVSGGDMAIGEPFDQSYGAAHADPNTNPYDQPIAEPAVAPADRHVPLVAVALILAVCVSAGAATAAYVFHDRLTQIIVPRAASR